MALIYPPGVDLICSFYGCLYVGVVPVTIRPPHPQNLQTTLPTVRMIVDVSKSVVILSSAPVIKLLKSKEASNVVDIKSWPPTLDTDELPRKKLPGVYRAPTAELVAYLDFSVSTTGNTISVLGPRYILKKSLTSTAARYASWDQDVSLLHNCTLQSYEAPVRALSKVFTQLLSVIFLSSEAHPIYLPLSLIHI